MKKIGKSKIGVCKSQASWWNKSTRLHRFLVSHQSDAKPVPSFFTGLDVQIKCVDVVFVWAHLWVSGWSRASLGVPAWRRWPPLPLTAHRGRVRTAAVDWRQWTVSQVRGIVLKNTHSYLINRYQSTQGCLSSSPSINLSIWLCSLDPLLHIHSLYALNTKLFKREKCLNKKPRRKRKGKHFHNVFSPKGQLKHWDLRLLHSMRHLVSSLCITQSSEWQKNPKNLGCRATRMLRRQTHFQCLSKLSFWGTQLSNKWFI